MNDIIASLMLLGALGSGNGYLPYWATTNQWGLMPERDGALAVVQAYQPYKALGAFEWEWGASFAANAYNNPLDEGSNSTHVMVDQLYAGLKWKCLSLDLGQKHRDLEFMASDPSLGSLSVTGGHVAESGNARPMPGYLATLDPVAVPFTGKHLWLYGAYGDYTTMDTRYVQGTLVHRTRVFLRGDIGRVSLHAGLDHYAMWAGTSQKYGVQPHSFMDYIRMVTGSHAGSDGTVSDQVNVIGDQGGGELLRADYRGNGWKVTLQHDIPYADGSGMGFQNFPDGVNTIWFGWDDKDRWVSDILFEHQYTMYQSGPINGETIDENGNNVTPKGVKTTGGDNYFANGQYKSSWTHYGRLIADPLCLPLGVHEGTWSSAVMNLGIENNRLRSQHFAISGKLWRKHPYKLMLTRSVNYGSYSTPYVGESQWGHEWGTVKETGLKQFSGAFMGSFNIIKGFSLVYGLYVDKGELYEDQFGATLGLRYKLGK